MYIQEKKILLNEIEEQLEIRPIYQPELSSYIYIMEIMNFR